LSWLQVSGAAFHVAQDLPGFVDELEMDEHRGGRFAHILGLAGDLKLCITEARVGLNLPAIQDLVGTDRERFARCDFSWSVAVFLGLLRSLLGRGYFRDGLIDSLASSADESNAADDADQHQSQDDQQDDQPRPPFLLRGWSLAGLRIWSRGGWPRHAGRCAHRWLLFW
jgi:hypothetical protein